VNNLYDCSFIPIFNTKNLVRRSKKRVRINSNIQLSSSNNLDDLGSVLSGTLPHPFSDYSQDYRGRTMYRGRSMRSRQGFDSPWVNGRDLSDSDTDEDGSDIDDGPYDPDVGRTVRATPRLNATTLPNGLGTLMTPVAPDPFLFPRERRSSRKSRRRSRSSRRHSSRRSHKNPSHHLPQGQWLYNTPLPNGQGTLVAPAAQQFSAYPQYGNQAPYQPPYYEPTHPVYTATPAAPPAAPLYGTPPTRPIVPVASTNYNYIYAYPQTPATVLVPVYPLPPPPTPAVVFPAQIPVRPCYMNCTPMASPSKFTPPCVPSPLPACHSQGLVDAPLLPQFSPRRPTDDIRPDGGDPETTTLLDKYLYNLNLSWDLRTPPYTAATRQFHNNSEPGDIAYQMFTHDLDTPALSDAITQVTIGMLDIKYYRLIDTFGNITVKKGTFGAITTRNILEAIHQYFLTPLTTDDMNNLAPSTADGNCLAAARERRERSWNLPGDSDMFRRCDLLDTSALFGRLYLQNKLPTSAYFVMSIRPQHV